MRGIAKAMLLAAMAATGSTAALAGSPSACHGPDDQIFYVADVRIITDKPYGPKRVFTLRVDTANGADVFFTPALDTPDERALADAYTTLIVSRLHDRRLGVEPKLKTGQHGDGKSFTTAYELGALSTGALPGSCPARR